MSLETQESVEELGRELGERIADLPEYEAFEEAKREVEAADGLQSEISEFEQLRQEFMLAQQTGEATQEDVEELKRAQRELHGHPKMAAYLEAKEELQDRLEAVNEAVSDPLEVDFGGEAGGCCHD
ncbi:MAG: YlbF family regulator [Halobacteriaceae archaeon]